MKIRHGTQIVYPKDLGYIVARAGIESGQKIVEIGTGSGSLTSFVAGIVKPRGHVYTFDANEEFMKIAKKNIEKAGLLKYVTMKKLDLKKTKKVPVSNADLVLIDLGDPWTVLEQARKMLKGSGGIFAICPTMNQLEKLTAAFVQNEFTDIECTEHILRTIEAREGKTRHSFQGIGHTTYLAYARKAFFARGKLKKTINTKSPSKT
jgi:tRNA (adenine57-N1/adenine58-N1)-methyltransferase